MAGSHDITFIGIGNMGSAVVQALLRAGNRVTLWNRTPDRPQVRTAVEAGGVFEANLSAAIEKNNAIAMCVLDYGKIKSIVSSLPQGAFKGKILVNLTNGTPKQAQEMAEWAKSQGVASYFDGAIMVTPQMIGGPHSFLVISGETPDSFGDISSLLSAIGNPQYLGDEVGAAARYDVAALATMYGMFSGAFLGMGLLKQGGPDVKLAPVVSESLVPFLAALVPYLGLIAKSWDEETWDENMGNPMGMQVEAIKNIIQACKEDDVDSGPMAYFAKLMQRVVDEHGDDAGIAVLGTYLLE